MMKLDFPQFIAKSAMTGKRKDAFDAVLVDVLDGNKALSYRIGSGGVEISADQPARLQEGGVLLEGSWASRFFSGASLEQAPARLVAPLLFRPSRIVFSHSALTTFRHEHRSAADVMMRNLYGAIWLGGPIDFHHVESRLSKAELKLRSDLVRRYLWVLHAVLEDDGLKSGDIANKLVANGHFRIIDFDSAVLNAGFGAFRDSISSQDSHARQVQRFDEVRDGMLALFS